MQNVLLTGKRAVSVAVVAATMLFSVGAGLLQPSVAGAASAGDLIKGTSLSTVYYLAFDGMRYTFPNEKTYKTWYSDFSGVITISDSALADLSLAGNVVYRPGSQWIKVQSDDKVYAVSTDGSIHWIESEEVAVDYAGSSWASRVQDVPDVFFTDYTVGSSLMTATAFDGMMYMSGGNYYVASSGEARMVSSAGRDANGLQSGFFLSGSGIDASSLSVGSDITAGESSIMDAAQQLVDASIATGDVSISLASTTPASSTIPDAASGVTVAIFKITAGDAATINVMDVALMGLAATSNFASSGVYLYEGSDRLTDGKSFNSSTRKAVFGSLNLAFGAGETRYISVVVDMGGDNNTTSFSVGLAGLADVEASGSVSGSFPISGNIMNIVDSDVGSIDIIDTGSLSDPVVGATGAVISQFKLTAGPAEDVSFERITLKIADAADHNNFKLWQGTTKLADGAYIGNKLVLFDLSAFPYSIDKGGNKTFKVSADIGGQATETIVTHLDNSADLYVVGKDYGFGVTVDRTGFDGPSGENSTVTIQGGDLTVAFSGPAATDISDTANDVSFFQGTLTAELAMTITAMPFIVEADVLENLSDQPISDIRIVNADTGALLMGPLDLDVGGGDTTQVLAFTDDFDMAAGESLNFKITADMEIPSDANQTFVFTMDLSSGLTAEDMSGDSIASIIPAADLAGNTQTVQVSGLTVTLASTPTGTKTFVRGSSNVPMVSFNFAAATGGDIEVTDFAPSVYVDDNSDSGGTLALGQQGSVASTARITSCSLYSGATLVSGPKSVDSATTGKLNFANFSYLVIAGTTQTLSVHCNLANIDPGAADLFGVGVAVPGDVTALDEQGDSATVTGTAVNTTTPSMIISVVNAGSLAVTAASDAPSADYVLTGSTSNTVSKFRFDATSEAFVVNRLTIEEAQGHADGAAVGAYANNVSLVTISYPDSTGATKTASGALTSNGITFNDLTFYVGKDGNSSVTVRIDVPSTDRSSGSATSNERIRMVLDDGTGELRAVGQSSGQTLTTTISGVATAGTTMNKFVVRETKPTVSLSSSTPAAATNVVAMDREMLRFTVAASSGEDVVLNNLIFTMSSTDGAGSDWNQCGNTLVGDFDLYDSTDLTTALAATKTMLAATGATCSSADVAFIMYALTTPEVITAGTTATYSLYFDSAGASSVEDDSVVLGMATDPITTNYIEVVNATDETSILITDSTINVDTGGTYAVGDVIAYDETDANGGASPSSSERMLVTAITGNVLSVIRGYMGTTPVAYSSLSTTADDMYRLPGALLWQDDGSTGVTSATTSLLEYYGGHLVKTLPITGNGISF